MEKTLGQMIGHVEHSFSVKNDHGESVQLRLIIDFSTSTDVEIRNWLVANRVIAFQRPARSLSKDELKALDGSTVLANQAGQKIKSREEQLNQLITTFVNAGVSREQAKVLATAALDNPASLTIKE